MASQIATIMYITVENAQGEHADDTHLTTSQYVYAAVAFSWFALMPRSQSHARSNG